MQTLDFCFHPGLNIPVYFFSSAASWINGVADTESHLAWFHRPLSLGPEITRIVRYRHDQMPAFLREQGAAFAIAPCGPDRHPRAFGKDGYIDAFFKPAGAFLDDLSHRDSTAGAIDRYRFERLQTPAEKWYPQQLAL